MIQALAWRLHLYPAPQGGLGLVPAGHSFQTGDPVSQPSTTQPPLRATWHPGPQDSFAIAVVPSAARPINTAARNISLIDLLQGQPVGSFPRIIGKHKVLGPFQQKHKTSPIRGRLIRAGKSASCM
ncbi:hypothetical protein BRADO4299 [Bradyrhizobium sp. ORS 278]|nr:hypothetical protein BRADO4299 [Bradyrhizobium sp. ORS 278]